MTESMPQPPPIRIENIPVDEDTMVLLRWLAREQDINESQALRAALMFAETLVECLDDGGTIVFRTRDGGEVEACWGEGRTVVVKATEAKRKRRTGNKSNKDTNNKDKTDE